MEPVEVTAVRRRRVAAKGWITRISKQLEDLLDSGDLNVTELEEAITDFEDKLRTLDEVQNEIELYLDISELETDLNTAAKFRCDKKKILSKAKDCFKKLKDSDRSERESIDDVQSIVNSIKDNSLSTKLPTLEIEKFDGDYTKWSTFWDKFTAVIDCSNIPIVNKFTYLQSLLLGEAAAAIRGLSLTESNYSSAKELLQQRFGRPERIIFGHIQQLLKTGSTKEGSSHTTSLWGLYDEIQANVRSLQNLGIGGEEYGVFLTPLVLNRLPTTIRMEWARVAEGKEGDLAFLLDFLFREIQRRERSTTFGSTNTQKTEAKKELKTTTSALMTKTATGQPRPSWTKKRLTCVFCKAEHYPDKCSEIVSCDFEARREKIKDLRLCFICLGPHLAKNCNKVCFYCKGHHHAVLCRKHIENKTQDQGGVPSTVEHDRPTDAQITYSKTKTGNTVMQVVKTYIKGVEVNVMFDSGSDRSFITDTCAKKLGLEVTKQEYLQYSCFGNQNKVYDGKPKNVYELEVQDMKLNLIGMEVICSSMYRAPVPQQVLDNFRHLKFNENFDEGRSVQVDILIGLDHYWYLIKNRHQVEKGLVAQETVFGWMLSGEWCVNKNETHSPESGSANCVSLFCHSELSDIDVRHLWDLETIGIRPCEEEIDTVGMPFLDSFQKDISFENGRYSVKLPWKNDSCKETLLNNHDHALKRLSRLKPRLESEGLKEKYDEVIEDWERQGIVTEILSSEVETENPVYYLPHRPVIRTESLTTKIRPIFDASAKGKNGVSLNDCMFTGPNLIPELLPIILRFRKWRFGLTSDITKAFLQIKVHKPDQDVHRFLWNVNDQIKTMKFDRVIFGNTSSPFLLNATIKFHLSHFETSKTIEELKENLYVDDWLTGADTEEEIIAMTKEAEQVMRLGSFPLAKWASSCQAVKKELSKCFDSYKEIECLKVLGISWVTDEDCFVFETIDIGIPEITLFTKRIVLSLSARIFDPLGLLTPFTITLKMLFQKAWQIGYHWDDILPIEFQTALRLWVTELQEIKKWKIPRRITDQDWDSGSEKQLIAFCDASEKAYGCCIYLVTSYNGNCSSCLVTTKVKVAPLKKLTLPRLELMGALLASRLLVFVRSALGLSLSTLYTCYTDSQIVLHWIQSDPSKWKQFVSNRVSEIRKLTDSTCWRHCPGIENTADLLTRGVHAQQLIESPCWLVGPSWLGSEPNFKSESEGQVVDIANEEVKTRMELTSLAVVNDSEKSCPLIEYEKFSEFGKLVRVVGWVKRFISNVRNRLSRESSDCLLDDELYKAKSAIIKNLQSQFYHQEILDFEQNRVVNKRSSISKLSPFVGPDGLLRVHGRLEFASSLLYDEKYPILLPKCHVSYLLIKAQHISMKHAGVNTLIVTVRNKYWIVSLRSLAKQVCKHCIDCQRQDARPYDQATAPLPEDRIKESPPFSVIGLDYAGPLYCLDTGTKKLYILLITCAITRAIHVELVDSLSLEDFVYAFRRFSARRGMPRVVYSDNAKTFKGASLLIKRKLSHVDITWKFNAPLAPWWGGWWERLVRSVKSGLKKSLGIRLVSRVELDTSLQEIEACVNSRPLTYVSDTGFPITPSHFLIGRSSPMINVNDIRYSEEAKDLVLRDKCQTQIVDTFWNIWRNDYIRNLPPMKAKKANADVKVGTLVLIKKEGKPRLQWPLGIISKLFPGKDGLIRAVELKTAKGVLCRAVQKLFKLEVFVDHSVDSISQEVESSQDEGIEPCTNTGTESCKMPQQVSRKGRPLKPRKVLDL